jgi:hypothetical protein
VALREPIYQALFDLVTNFPAVRAQFRTFGRLLPHVEDVSAAQCPALYTFQLPERRVYKGKGIPAIRTLFVAFVAYFAGGPPGTGPLPATAINTAADAIDDAISNPGNPQNTQTLGGLVEHVYIEPDIRPYEGLLQEKSVLVSVVSVLIP